MKTVGCLICGHDKCEGVAKVALGQLCSSIDTFASKAMGFLNNPVSDDTLTFGPFCARVLLENSYAAILGRLDTFRMLYLSEFQAQPEYEHGKRARSSFSWTGDVMPDDKATPNLWSSDNELPKISRALFSKHLEHVYWRPAVERMLDYVSQHPSIPALVDVLSIDADNFINETKGRSIQLYSTLSKGVHWEFFTSALLFDEATVKNAIRETFLLVGNLGLASNFVPTAYASHEPSVAVEEYISLRGLVP